MNYTFQKRRELNDAFRSYLLAETIHEHKDGGVPMLHIDRLPSNTCAIDSVQELSRLLPYNDRAWRTVVPVFIKQQRLNADGLAAATYYDLNYVNCSAPSMERAAELVASGRMFWIPNLTINLNGKRN